MRLTALFTIFALFCASSALACGPDTDCKLGSRHYRIAMPEGHDGTTPVGAIVFAHGYRGSARGLMRNKSLRRMVSDLGLALIALKSEGNDWNLPNSPSHGDADGSVEFAYVDAVLRDAARRFFIDDTRIMATGFSAGGMLVWNLACAMPDRFAGFAPIAGTFWKGPPKTCVSPVANVVHIHGDADRTVPLAGRKIAATRQGDVFEILDMYRKFGGFRSEAPSSHGDLSCEGSTNAEGDILNFCLFPGGHSFRTEYVRLAWEMLNQAGRF